MDIQNFLPQRPPFIMVDRMLFFYDKTVVTELEIRKDNLFFCDGELLASGLIENIAQTCTLCMIGYRKKDGIKIAQTGVIGALNNLNINRLPREGEKIKTIVSLVGEMFQMMMFDAMIKSRDEELVKASIKTALTDITVAR